MKIQSKYLLLILLSFLVLVGCKKQKVTISVYSIEPTCIVSGGGTFEWGTEISISAIPADGYKFLYWENSITLETDASNPKYITANANVSYTAYFEKINNGGGNGGGGNSSTISAPIGVTATKYDETYIYVEWNAVSNATSYNLYYCSTYNGSYSKISDNLERAYCYVNYNGVSGDYYFKITAVNSSGVESSMSSYARCSISNGGGGGTSVPGTPTGVTATNTGTSASPKIKISWSSVSGATSYKVYRSSTAGGTYSQIGSATSYTYLYDNSPLSGYNYYKVKAFNSAGESSYSSYAYYNNTNNGGGGGGGTTTYSPCPPTVSVSGTSSQTVSWTISTSSGCGSPTSFEVYKFEPCANTWTLKTTTTSRTYYVSSSDIHPGINRYAVKAINSAGSDANYAYSSSVSLAAPTSFTAQKSGSNVTFTWSKVAKATGYQIYESSSASGTYTILDRIDNVNTTTLTRYYPASSGTTRYFKIEAFFDCDGVGGPIYSSKTTYKSVTF